jgi:streptogrisin C
MSTPNRSRSRLLRLWALTAAAAMSTTMTVAVSSPSHAAEEGGSGGLDQQVLDTVAAQQGISAEEARGRLDRQDELATAAAEIDPKLDTSKTAGSYIDQGSGKLVVNVTEAGAAGELDQDKVTEQQVTHSTDTLNSSRDSLRQAARDTGISWVQIWVDVRGNVVQAQVSRTAAQTPEGQAFTQQAQALGGTVTVTEIKDTEPSVVHEGIDPGTQEVANGDKIVPAKAFCSVGWNVKDANQQNALVTAGHCMDAGSNPHWAHLQTGIGQVQTSNLGPQDWGLVRYDDGQSQPSASVNLYTDSGAQATVTDNSRAPVGSIICRSGAMSGLSCGEVTAYEVTKVAALTASGVKTLEGMVGAKLCADGGDSGGAIYVPHTDGTVSAQGTTSGGVEACNPEAGKGDAEIIDAGMTYQPIDTLLHEQGLTLHTEQAPAQ